MKLQTKFQLLILPCLLVTVLVLAAVEYYFLLQDEMRALRQRVELQHHSLLKAAQQQLQLELAQLKAISRIGEMDDYFSTSNEKLRENSLKPRLMLVLDDLTKAFSHFKRLGLYDHQNNELLMVGEGVDPFAPTDELNLALLADMPNVPSVKVVLNGLNGSASHSIRIAERFSPSLYQRPADRTQAVLYTLIATLDRRDFFAALDALYREEQIAMLVFNEQLELIWAPQALALEYGDSSLFRPLQQALIHQQHFALADQGDFYPVSQRTGTYSTSIMMVSRASEVRAANRYLWRVSILFIAVLLLLFWLLRWAIKRSVITPLSQLRHRIRAVEEGRPEEVATVIDGDELTALNNSFADMVVAIRQSQDDLEKMAFTDQLTGLPNRLWMQRQLHGLAADKAVLIIVDIDRFKYLNEIHGDKGGDQLLRSVAGLIAGLMQQAQCADETDQADQPWLLARIAGDEFAILMVNANLEVAESLAQRMQGMLAQPIAVGAGQAYLQVSAGIAAYPQHAACLADLQKMAEAAKQLAKRKGGAQCQLFNQQIADQLLEKEVIERALNNALQQNEFELHFQPFVSVSSREIVGAEALLRWQSATLGRVTPDKFIPIAEQSGLIYAVDRWVIDSACQALAKISRLSGQEHFCMSINVSNSHMQQPGLADYVAECLRRYRLTAAQVEIEITETATAELDKYFLANAHALKQLGVGLVLDDFGTGYTSLAHLGQLPVTKLKLDRSHTAEIGRKLVGDTPGVAKVVLDFAHAYSLKVTAEGVEEQGQVDFLRREGCDFMQGYFLYKPMPFHHVISLFVPRSED